MDYVRLIDNNSFLNANGIYCLNELAELNKHPVAELCPLYEEIDNKNKFIELTLPKYDRFLQLLCTMYLRIQPQQFDKALMTVNRLINFLSQRSLPGNAENKIAIAMFLARIQIEYYENVSCLNDLNKFPASEQYEFYRKTRETLDKAVLLGEDFQKILQNPLEISDQMLSILPEIINGQAPGRFQSMNRSVLPPAQNLTFFPSAGSSSQGNRVKYYISRSRSELDSVLASKQYELIPDDTSTGIWVKIDPSLFTKNIRDKLDLFKVKFKESDQVLRDNIKAGLRFATIEEGDAGSILVTAANNQRKLLDQIGKDWEAEQKKKPSIFKRGFMN